MKALVRFDSGHESAIDGIVDLRTDGPWLIVQCEDGTGYIWSAEAVREVVYHKEGPQS